MLTPEAGWVDLDPTSGRVGPQGLIRIAQGRTERLTRADGLSGDAVNDVFEDREGNLWVATTAGLDQLHDVKVATLTAQEGVGGGDIGAVVGIARRT